jgi:hypothetical protein
MEEWRYSSTILDLGAGWSLVVRLTPRPLHPGERAPGIYWIRRLGGPQSRSGGEDKKLAMPGIEPGLPRPYLVALPTELSRILTQSNTITSSSSSSYMALQPISGLGLLFMRFRNLTLIDSL